MCSGSNRPSTPGQIDQLFRYKLIIRTGGECVTGNESMIQATRIILVSELSDKQWQKIRDLVPGGVRRIDGKGRPWPDKREVLEGVL